MAGKDVRAGCKRSQQNLEQCGIREKESTFQPSLPTYELVGLKHRAEQHIKAKKIASCKVQ